MVASEQYTPFYGTTGIVDGDNLSFYLDSLNLAITPATLTIENAPGNTDTFDYSITVQGASGSAAAFSKSLLFWIALKFPETNIAETDLLFSGNFNAIQNNFFSTFLSVANLEGTFIPAVVSILPSPFNANVSIGREYVANIAYLYTGDPKTSDIFNNSETVRETIDGAFTVNGSIINGTDAVFNSIAETLLSNYSAITATSSILLGAQAALTAFKVITTHGEDRLTRNSNGSIALSPAVSPNIPTNSTGENVYQMPFYVGDNISFGLTINIPPSQFGTTTPITPNSNVTTTSYSVLINYVLNYILFNL